MGQFGDFLNTSLGGQITGGIMGMALQGWNDRRQLSQQQKLHEMQMMYEQRMGRFNKELGLEMWRDTSYPAQMEMMKKAGLNPALMYGMGGGGGQSTNTGGSAHGSGGNAPVGGQEIQAMAGMGIQAKLADAQVELMKAQANLANTEATKKGGVDTELGKTEIEFKKVQTQIAKIDELIKGETKQDAINAIGWQAEKILNEMNNLRLEGDITAAVLEQKKEIVRQELAGKLLQNTLTEKQSNKIDAEIIKMATELKQKWSELNIKTFEAEIKANYPSIMSLPGNMYQKLYNTLDKIFGEKTDHTPIKVNK